MKLSFAIALNEICVIVKYEDDSMIKIWNGFRIAKEDNLRFEELGTRKIAKEEFI